MITGYLEKIEQSDAHRFAGQETADSARQHCKTEEDWFGRWLGFLAITCPDPLIVSCKGKNLSQPTLPQLRG